MLYKVAMRIMEAQINGRKTKIKEIYVLPMQFEDEKYEVL